MYSKPTFEINLDNLLKNYNNARKIYKCGAVVKCNAYGFGAKQVVQKLANESDCEDFFVSTVDEAIEIKDYIIGKNIYVLSGFQKDELDLVWDNNFIPVCGDAREILEWYSHGISNDTQKPIVVQIETGLNRLGIEKSEFLDVVQKCPHINILFIMHHLACGYNIGDELNVKQMEIMRSIHKFQKSMSASCGLLFPKIDENYLLRLGRFLYGSDEQCNTFPVANVGSIYGQIISTKHIKKGEPIGYFGDCIASDDMVVGIVNLGYGDGIIVRNGHVFTNGIYSKILAYSMDYITIDLTNVTLHNNLVEFLGKHITFDKVAKWTYSARGFEITCCLGRRLSRVYVG
ncbi:MAG: alanine racemase [Alphaproteobacteria bacterium]|nr:MAG: alanine racemase [Alphaproteobacteria bacterium]